jgi:hypothetical protein
MKNEEKGFPRVNIPPPRLRLSKYVILPLKMTQKKQDHFDLAFSSLVSN